MTQRLLHIGVDLDGTLADHTQAKLVLAREFGRKLLPYETASEVIKKLLPEKEYRLLQNRLYTDMSNFSRPFDGVEEALKEFSPSEYKVFLVSRRKEDGRRTAQDWIAEHLSTAVFSGGIFFVDSDREKDVVCRNEGIEVFIDDQIKVLEFLSSVQLSILFDPFGNFSDVLPSGIVSCDDWRQIPERIRAHVVEKR